MCRQVGLEDAVQEAMVRFGVESFGEVQSHDGCSGRRLLLVEAPHYGLCDREKCSGGGSGRPEAVLRLHEAEAQLEVPENDPLEDLDCG